SRHYSAMSPRLDTGGWLALTQMLLSIYSLQGLSPCQIHRAFLGAITDYLSGKNRFSIYY
ncbi:hypothetical protein KJ966_14415, partial [bacterium]|nr:hypothetical protein [bacterium]